MTKSKLHEKIQKCLPVLQSQRITLDEPGTILRDVGIMLDGIGAGVSTGGKNANLPLSMLPSLNARMGDPIELAMKRALLKDYPNIAGVYILLRCLNLVIPEGRKIIIDQERLEIWNGLNVVEQYFALLESWLLSAHTSVLGGELRDEGTKQIEIYPSALASMPVQSWKETFAVQGWRRLPMAENWNFQLLLRFGLAKIRVAGTTREPKSAMGWSAKQIRATPWGEAAASCILATALDRDCDSGDSRDVFLWEDADYEGLIRSSFDGYFPEFRRTMEAPVLKALEGVYVFKVTMPRPGGVMRRIIFSSESSLAEVASGILAAFKFDNDHPYVFSYRDIAGQAHKYWHPFCEPGPFADEVILEESGLREKADLTFRFDFGASWDFNLRLEKIAPEDLSVNSGTVLESVGEPPEQYPQCEG